ncbi:MAG: hypothetical protein ACYSSP_10905 [Planctomycetota bacterium]|jgi:hypothetical protein
METYEAKARIWNINWNGHEIRLEFITKSSDVWSPHIILFFDGKRVGVSTNHSYGGYAASGSIKVDNGQSYQIGCGVNYRVNCKHQWPLRKSFWGGVADWIDRCLSSYKYYAWLSINEDLIYLSHIGGADTIEWVLIQQDLDHLEKEERALAQGKIMIHTSSGYRKENRTKDKLKQTQIHLANKRKELESRLSSLESQK